ncbi:MAG: TonB-dependent receptor [Cyclobacteriaceae bacterium]|nr:TonB-dependent receptor [Cyclobacteriaceae bacterium]
MVLSVASLAQEADTLTSKELESVVVTGQYEPQSMKKSVYQVRTIPSQFIRSRNATNLQSILTTELGIRFSTDPTLGTSDITLMGMSGQNVKILMDGVPLVDRGATRESLGQIDVNTIERIEIVEGPMSVLYGSDALAGVINIITKKAAGAYEGEKLSVEAKIQEETVGSEYEPFAGKGSHLENVSVNWGLKNWEAGAGVTRNAFGGWQGSKTGRQKQWHDKDQYLGNVSAGFRKENYNLWYRLNYLNESILAQGDVNPDNNMAGDKEYITNRFTHQLQGEWKANSRWSFNGVLSYQDYSRKTQSTNINVVTGDRRLSLEPGSQDESIFQTEIVRGVSVFKWSDKVSLQSGIDFTFNQGSGDRIDGSKSINDYAVFVSAEYSPWSALSIRPGLRFIKNTQYDAPPAVPSLNAKYSITPSVEWRFSYARGFRAPALRELYFYFFDASHSIKGNTDLKAEFSNSYSTSFNVKVPTNSGVSMNVKVGGFYNEFENLIALGIDPNDQTVYTYVNVLKSRTSGGTLDNSVTWRNLKAMLGGAYIGVYNQFNDYDQSVPSMVWTPEINSVITYSFPRIGLELSGFYKWTGSRQTYQLFTETDGSQQVGQGKISSFQWADFTASKTLGKLLRLSAGVKNVFDVTQLQNSLGVSGGAHSSGGSVPMGYGRSYFVGVSFHWNKN